MKTPPNDMNVRRRTGARKYCLLNSAIVSSTSFSAAIAGIFRAASLQFTEEGFSFWDTRLSLVVGEPQLAPFWIQTSVFSAKVQDTSVLAIVAGMVKFPISNSYPTHLV
jgi:hypothetical protein